LEHRFWLPVRVLALNSLDLLWRLLCLATAYKAKLLCSGVFVSQRSPKSLLNQDLAVDELFFLRFISTTIDAEAQIVTASIFGLARRTALYRPGLGSTLVIDTTLEALRQQVPDITSSSQHPEQKLLPRSLAPSPPSSQSPVLQTLDRAFAKPHRQRTRAVVIAQAGEILAERYAPGFNAAMPLLGWSMTKSVINALVGILVHQGKLALDQCALLPEWDAPEDPRRAITLDQLLRMRSGLQFEEVYADPRSHVTTMLFQRGDAAGYAASLPMADPEGAWSYASGTTNILCRIIRQALGDSLADYWAFPHQLRCLSHWGWVAPCLNRMRRAPLWAPHLCMPPLGIGLNWASFTYKTVVGRGSGFCQRGGCNIPPLPVIRASAMGRTFGGRYRFPLRLSKCPRPTAARRYVDGVGVPGANPDDDPIAATGGGAARALPTQPQLGP
jgi:hypothetical protein